MKSSVRQQIRDEHKELRGMLDDVDALARRFEVGDLEVEGILRQRGRLLYRKLAKHIDHEDAVLAPALRASGPAGGRSAERLTHEHIEQRQLLEYLLGRLEAERNPTILIARELKNFVEYVRIDMAHEENAILDEKPFQDDAV